MKLVDAQASTAFVISQSTHIEQGVYQIQYADIQYPDLIPVDTSAHPFAKTVTYFSQDKFGKAGWINGNADDIPLAGTERTKFETPVYTAAIGYGFGYEEINQAIWLGRDLQSDDAAAARRASEEMIDRVALLGDTEKNLTGLINNSSVTAAALTTGGWGTATPAQMVTDINNVLNAQGTGANYVQIADTLLLPYAKLNFLANTQMPNTTMSVLEWIRAHNVSTMLTGKPLTIRAIRGLDTAGSGSTARIVAYKRDPQVLKLHLPMPLRFLPVFQEGPLYWAVPGLFRLGGLDIRQPSAVRYGDGA